MSHPTQPGAGQQPVPPHYGGPQNPGGPQQGGPQGPAGPQYGAPPPGWGPTPPHGQPPRGAGRNVGLLVSGAVFVLVLVVFLFTGLVAPGYLRGDDSGSTAPATTSTTSQSTEEPTEQPTSGTADRPAQDPAYMKPMQAFVAQLNNKNAAAANALACKDDKSQAQVVQQVAKAAKQNPKLTVVMENSGFVVDGVASLELQGTIGGREVPLVPVAGKPNAKVHAAGVIASEVGSSWCISSFTSGFEDIDGR